MRSTRGLFVTATDTEVGKTVISAALVLYLRHMGIDAGYIKSVSTDGVEQEGSLVSPDALRINLFSSAILISLHLIKIP